MTCLWPNWCTICNGMILYFHAHLHENGYYSKTWCDAAKWITFSESTGLNWQKITLSGPSILWKIQICWPGRSGRFMNYIWNSNRYFRKTFVSSKMKPFLGDSVTLLVSSPKVPRWSIRSRALQGTVCGVRYCRLPS